MRLVVQVLRISILFLNVYDTYKTLKPPALSKRNVGQLSTRALNRRKRDMKGCLSVWIVWVSMHLESGSHLLLMSYSPVLSCCL
jgi:receptor expression-enhancing protein 5/6